MPVPIQIQGRLLVEPGTIRSSWEQFYVWQLIPTYAANFLSATMSIANFDTALDLGDQQNNTCISMQAPCGWILPSNGVYQSLWPMTYDYNPPVCVQ
jgi:hypothetical protein